MIGEKRETRRTRAIASRWTTAAAARGKTAWSEGEYRQRCGRAEVGREKEGRGSACISVLFSGV